MTLWYFIVVIIGVTIYVWLFLNFWIKTFKKYQKYELLLFEVEQGVISLSRTEI